FDCFAPNFLAPEFILGSALFTCACGEDDNVEASRSTITSDDDAGGGGGDETSAASETTDGNDPGNDSDASVDPKPQPEDDAGNDKDPVVIDGGVDTVVVPPDGGNEPQPSGCVENDDPCFSCPSTPEQFLKQCTESLCEPFDNAKRLGRYEAGKPLPTR